MALARRLTRMVVAAGLVALIAYALEVAYLGWLPNGPLWLSSVVAVGCLVSLVCRG